MKRYFIIAMILVAVLVAGVLTGCNAGSPGSYFPPDLNVRLNSAQEGISVSGQGKVTASPDIVNLSLGVSAQSASVADAQSNASQAMDKVMSVLTSNGIAKKDIQTTSFSIQQVTRYDNDKPQEVVIGYRVSNMVNIKIRALDKIGPIVDAVAAAGGDFTRINGISFGIEDPTKYNADAREKAMNDAKAKADQIAKLAGVTLGKPVLISESSYYPPPMPYAVPAFKDAAASGAATSISPGEMDITLNVQVTYQIS